MGAPSGSSNCEPSYPDICIPIGSADLDCGDLDARRFRVLWNVANPDPHRFDGDGDGIGYAVDPDDRNRGRWAGAYLVSNQCMDGELLKPADPVATMQSLAFSYEGIGLGVVGIGLVTGVGMHRWHRRRSDRDAQNLR